MLQVYIFAPLYNVIISDKADTIKYLLAVFVVIVLILSG